VRAGIVGTGWVAPVHAHALRELGVEVAGFCGRTPTSADALAAEFGGSTWSDLEEMLREEQVDVLHVCTPNDLHAPQTLLAFEHGVHVVCEKPLATSAAESAQLVQAAQERGLVGAVAHHVRGYPLVAHMRSEIAAGSLGDVRVVHGRYLNDEALLPDYTWRFKPEQSGPSYVMGDLGTHWLDTAEHVTGLRIAEVLAEFRTFEGEKEGTALSLDDTAAVLLRFEGGAVGTILIAGTAPGRKNQLVLECEGSRGGFTWDQEQPELLLDRPADGPQRLVLKDGGLARFPPGHVEGYGDAFRNILREAYCAIAGEPHGSFATFADGHRGMQLLEAIVESARTGRWVAAERG
jgi:predicted dehydrogenase